MTTERRATADAPRSLTFTDRLFWPGVVALVVVALVGTLVLVLGPVFGKDIALIDFAVYRWGGMHASSPDLYTGVVPAATIPGHVGDDLPFTYTPFAALVFIPFGSLPLALGQWVMLMINIGGLAGIAYVSFRAEGVERGRGCIGAALLVGAAAPLLEPGFQNLMFGQVNIVLVLLILWDALRPSGSTRGQGIAVGLAAALKLTPAIFILYFLVTGRWRAALRAGVTFVAATGFAALVLPDASHQYWVGRLFIDASRVGGVTYVGNQSLGGLVSRLTDVSLTASAVGIAAVALVVACGLGLAAVVERRRQRSLGALLVVAFTGLLISPISWSHHWIWVVPLLVLLITARVRGRRAAAWVAGVIVAALVMPGAIWQLPHGDGVERSWNVAQFVIGNSYVLLTVAAGVALVVVLLRSRGDTPGGEGGPGAPLNDPVRS